MRDMVEIGTAGYIRAHVKELNRRELEKVRSNEQFTKQQIQDHIEKVENVHIGSEDEGILLFESVAIIKQLQQEMYDIESDMNDSCLNRQVELD